MSTRRQEEEGEDGYAVAAAAAAGRPAGGAGAGASGGGKMDPLVKSLFHEQARSIVDIQVRQGESLSWLFA